MLMTGSISVALVSLVVFSGTMPVLALTSMPSMVTSIAMSIVPMVTMAPMVSMPTVVASMLALATLSFTILTVLNTDASALQEGHRVSARPCCRKAAARVIGASV
jgi:hypothetical protein